MRYVVGIDGGGTRTTVAVADETGREVSRRNGPAGLVDPRAPVATADVLVSVVQQALREGGIAEPITALCAGLAGAGNPAERELVHLALFNSGIAERIRVVSDGEIALEGAFRGGPGILLIAGTGSIAFGRAEDGRTERCGGWGMMVGDEGSGYAIGRAALTAVLRAVDGRGPETRLLPVLLERLELRDHRGIPPWAGRAAKGDVAALVPEVLRLAAEDDSVASAILHQAARDLAEHPAALVGRLAPWSATPRVVFGGGVLRSALFADLVTRAMRELVPDGFDLQPPAEDALGGAVRMAVAMLGG
jgi:glucosamine kinase